ncbi:MAG: DUF4118 domain-containing protein [Methylobacter sp.]|nr:DUF4118 domain-containing protein [Methylobacter sp.]
MNFFTKFEPFTRTGKNWNRLVDILAIYGFAVLAVAAAMGLRLALTARFGSGLPPYITFYPAVMAVAVLTGFGPSVLATSVSCGIAVYWILPPLGQFAVASPIDRVALIIFIGMGLFVSVTAEL